MDLRLFFYFFGAFFSSLGAGVSSSLSQDDWIRLIVMSLAAGFAAGKAYLDRGPQDPPAGKTMIAAAIAVLFFCTSCSTVVYGPNGKPQFRTYADITGLKFRGPGTRLEAETINHSAPTKAATSGATNLITAAGAAAAGIK